MPSIQMQIIPSGSSGWIYIFMLILANTFRIVIVIGSVIMSPFILCKKKIKCYHEYVLACFTFMNLFYFTLRL